MALQDDINNFGSSDTALDLVLLAAQIANTTTNRSIVVPTVNDLPDLSCNTVPPGTVIFVESIGVPVVSQVESWTGLDNRKLRDDYDIRLAYSWGFNGCGELGNGTTTSQSSPVSVLGGFTDWCQVSAGNGHNLGIRTNNPLYSWGLNTFGQLGDGTTISRLSPVIVVGGFTDWCQVSAGGCHSLGVRQDGTAWAWGAGTCGILGDGTTINRSSPVSVVGGFTDWCQVSAGGCHSLGVRQDGTAWAWGLGTSGQIGDGTTINRSSPVSIVGGFTDWCQVSSGNSFSLGLRISGTLWSWGVNVNNELGDGTSTSRSSPVSVVGGFTDWCQIDAGGFHTLGIRQDGTVWSWGSNFHGRLGDGTTVTKNSPVSVVGGFTDWGQVSAGGSHSLGLRVI
jgi:alpha-tubulin suppressor-like RCC1 family protein